jgi:hypothetical protein
MSPSADFSMRRRCSRTLRSSGSSIRGLRPAALARACTRDESSVLWAVAASCESSDAALPAASRAGNSAAGSAGWLGVVSRGSSEARPSRKFHRHRYRHSATRVDCETMRPKELAEFRPRRRVTEPHNRLARRGNRPRSDGLQGINSGHQGIARVEPLARRLGQYAAMAALHQVVCSQRRGPLSAFQTGLKPAGLERVGGRGWWFATDSPLEGDGFEPSVPP